MDDTDEKLPAPEPGQCGEHAHIFEWRSDLTATCPVSAKCYCGTTTYGAALQAMVPRHPPP